MTYNHERAKVICPEAAAEVERLRVEIQSAINELSSHSAMDCFEIEELVDHLGYVLGRGLAN